MRIVILSWTSEQVGGAERYLANLIPGLESRGHEIGLLIEMDVPMDRTPLTLSARAPTWSICRA